MLEGTKPNYFGILYVVIAAGLIAAKFIGHIHWSWWLVLAPIWVPIALFIVAGTIIICGFARAESKGENPFE